MTKNSTMSAWCNTQTFYIPVSQRFFHLHLVASIVHSVLRRALSKEVGLRMKFFSP